MPARRTAATIDEYLGDFPPETRALLERLRAVIAEEAPEATETISYAIPTFDLAGKHLVHFAGYAGHVGLYPTPSGVTEFAEELAAYRHGKGTARFPIDRPLPEELIRRIVRFRIAEVTGDGRPAQA